MAFLATTLAAPAACTTQLSTQDTEAASAELNETKQWVIASCKDFVLVALTTKSQTDIAVRKTPKGDNVQLFGEFKSPVVKSTNGRTIGSAEGWEISVSGGLHFGQDDNEVQYAYTETNEPSQNDIVRYGSVGTTPTTMNCTFNYANIRKTWPLISTKKLAAADDSAQADTTQLPPSRNSSGQTYCCKSENKCESRYVYQYCGASGFGFCQAYSCRFEDVCQNRNSGECP